MKRTAVLKRLKKQADKMGLEFDTNELKRHTAVTIGGLSRTLGRHSEIDDVTAGKFFDQFADVLGGKGWWR
ncbi:ribonuclease PH [Actinomyces urogenitalis]|uniref:ribonuclease PH n=1 Tax=Actinomyces urogenitalis TaxID=103621 RepID=UPI00189C076B|nr:ribonuclease PH [Actinomyces urogenitalis]